MAKRLRMAYRLCLIKFIDARSEANIEAINAIGMFNKKLID
jgi:hypothetical protein